MRNVHAGRLELPGQRLGQTPKGKLAAAEIGVAGEAGDGRRGAREDDGAPAPLHHPRDDLPSIIHVCTVSARDQRGRS